MKRKTFIRVAVTGFLAVMIAAFAPLTMHRHDFDHAYFVYSHNPSPENERLLRAELSKNDRIRLAIISVAALVIFAGLNGLWMAVAGTHSHNRASSGK